MLTLGILRNENFCISDGRLKLPLLSKILTGVALIPRITEMIFGVSINFVSAILEAAERIGRKVGEEGSRSRTPTLNIEMKSSRCTPEQGHHFRGHR